jgi:hypothetical protein
MATKRKPGIYVWVVRGDSAAGIYFFRKPLLDDIERLIDMADISIAWDYVDLLFGEIPEGEPIRFRLIAKR